MDKIKEHFEQEAHEFDKIILRLIPYYPQMLDALVTSIPFPENKKIKVIDLGCGTGTVSKKVKEKYPSSRIHCIDIAKNMIEIAKHKLSNYPDITYENADLSKYSFTNSYDVVLSSLTLHHLVTDDDKINFYTKIYHALNSNGIFYNADNVIGSNEPIQENNMIHWKEFMQKTVSVEEIEKKWIRKYNEEDRPAKLINQLNWLKDIGFVNIDVIWKYYNFAVYGGLKK
ncbi:MAG: class I SAM-dependent methyltransferase [Elusimicrobia bacterium]|nr:class I SAM-dependent methyltransferase [Elusimicrobiota bacterium]